MMEERHCPKCMEPIWKNEKFCHNCGFEIPPAQAVVKGGQPVSTRVLWLAAILILVGLILVGTLTAYVAVSSFSAENWGTLFAATPEPGSAASASSEAERSESAAWQVEPEALPLTELPSTAGSGYILLKKGLKAHRSGNEIEFACAAQNISEVVCTGVGVEVALYDAAKNFIGSSSSWVYRDVQPGEVVELSFIADNSENVRSYCLTKIGGEPVETPPSTEPEESDIPKTATSEEPVPEEEQLEDGGESSKEASAQQAPPALSDADVSLSYGLTLLDGAVEKAQENYLACLQGRVRNDSEIKYDAVYINFVIYDAENNQISTTITSTKDLEPGVVWKFSAPLLVPLDQAAKYKISSVSVY